MDLPPVEHVCEINRHQITQDETEIIMMLDYLIVHLNRSDALKNHDTAVYNTYIYLDCLRDQLAKKFNYNGMDTKGYWHNHNEEIKRYVKENEFASRDENYYRRYDGYDSPSYPAR